MRCRTEKGAMARRLCRTEHGACSHKNTAEGCSLCGRMENAMNLPNKLSITRVCLIPLCVVLLYIPQTWCRWAALAVFIIAAFTDFLDGKIARKRNLVTNFGKFIDPVADKLLVLCTMVALCGLGQFPAWVVIVVLFRELAVDGLRLVAMEQGHVIAAGQLGKIKTVTQLLTLILFLAIPTLGTHPVGIVLEWAIVLATLGSGAEYFVRNRSVLNLKNEKKG